MKQDDKKIPLAVLFVLSIIVLLDLVRFGGLDVYSFLEPLTDKLFKSYLFNNIYLVRVLEIGTSILLSATTVTRKKDTISNTSIAFALVIGLSFSLLSCFIEHNLLLYGFLLIMGLLSVLIAFVLMFNKINVGLKEDLFDRENTQFEQLEQTIENDLSVNIQTTYSYKNRKRKGMINIVAPQRATMILGTPGSGKSYSFVEEFIKQHTKKGFSFITYDFKFPTLTNVSYNYLRKYQSAYDKYENKVKFRVINLDQPKYSNRCNPIDPRIIKKEADASDAVMTIFQNIDKKSANKQDFFQMSAQSIVSATLWFLKIYKDGKYCDLPHLIEFIQRKDADILKILGSYPELTYFTSSFSDALEKEAYDQLSGQTASARIPLGKLVTKEMFYVLSDPDGDGIDLRVNKLDNVTHLVVANNPATQKTNGPALGLILSQSAKLINEQGRVPCEFLVDELPTVFINGLDTLIATARSNKVCVTLSFQDLAQLIRDYGKEIADSIFNTVGNVLSGSVVSETAKKISERIGNSIKQRKSMSINGNNTNISYSQQEGPLVPPHVISQLNQGVFAGTLANDFKYKLPLTIFHGSVSPDKTDLEENHIPEINPDLTEEDLKLNQKRIQDNITRLIKDELERIHNLVEST